MAITVEKWYSSCFSTSYYHILYKDRGYEEAVLFLKNFPSLLKLSRGVNNDFQSTIRRAEITLGSTLAGHPKDKFDQRELDSLISFFN